MRPSALPSTRFPASSSTDCSSAWRGRRSSGAGPASGYLASCPELALCLGADMPFEYRVVNTVEEANRLADDGLELVTILPPGPAGGPDAMYLRRDKRRGQTPGFARESKSG